MLERDPRRLAAWAVAALALAALSAWYLTQSRTSADPAPPPVPTIAVQGESEGGGKVTVDVAGEVKEPGVYLLASGARVEDALERAGGPSRKADLTQINRAAELEDGRQVLVPAKPSRSAVAAAPAPGGSAPAVPEQPINLNTATLEQLDTLDGVGPSTAQKILDYRTEHGGFTAIEELDQISGIGEKRLAALRERVRL
jgi:competence protein ComEA